jgi:hypothetical protein
MKEEMQKWMEEHWGKRCEEVNKECSLCFAWGCFDFLFEDME